MDSETSIGGPHGRFPSTQASLLEAVAAGLPGPALDQVIALYWKPVYLSRPRRAAILRHPDCAS